MPESTPRRYVAVGALMALMVGFLFWVGYSWPERRFELKARGVTAGVVEIDEQGHIDFSLTLEEQLRKLEQFHPDNLYLPDRRYTD